MAGLSKFLSTFPLRGTSGLTLGDPALLTISIHVPLAGNVCRCRIQRTVINNFYPRSPCGERPLPITGPQHGKLFLSTFPLRGTSGRGIFKRNVSNFISIHVPLAGNVRQSASSWRARGVISIHVPLAGNVSPPLPPPLGGEISIHVPLAGNVAQTSLTS